jgi:general secretion pathway protein F
MTVYDYTALDAKGKPLSGIIDADGAAAARQKIRAAGHFPVNLSEVSHGTSDTLHRQGFSLSQYFVRVRPAEVANMTRQLAILIGAGFPLVSAMETLMVQFPNPALKKTIAKIKDAVVEGSTFADALGNFPLIFTPIYANMVRSGETSGTLEIVLERLADITEKQEELKNKVVTAMIYPLVILLVGVLIMCFLFIYVIPNITSIFKDIKQELPLPTQLLIGTSEAFKSYWWVLIVLIIAVVMGLYRLRKNPKGRLWLDRTTLKLPMVGSLATKLAAGRFARTLGSLLDNGVSMLPAMEIVKNIVGNGYIAQAVATATVEVGKGQALGKSLDVHQIFPPIAIQMIMVGEQSGNLEQMLSKVADVFEKEVETSVMRMTALLEPIMVVIMAGMVLFIVLSIFMPILEMSNMVR